jgi:hypothetical protein
MSLLTGDRVAPDSCFAGILCLLRERRNIAGKLQAEHDERLEPIGFDKQKVMVAEPVVQTAKSIGARFHFDAAVNTKERDADITTEAATNSATQWHTLCGKAGILKRVHDCALDAVSFLPVARATHGILPTISSAQPIGVLGRPCESRSNALRRTSSGAPHWRAMLARIAASLAQASA